MYPTVYPGFRGHILNSLAQEEIHDSWVMGEEQGGSLLIPSITNCDGARAFALNFCTLVLN